jgi:hypothetical protein
MRVHKRFVFVSFAYPEGGLKLIRVLPDLELFLTGRRN